MLKSLPVSDPGRLYRVGEGDDCCVEGGPQDTWGMFSLPLFERLKQETPEFEEVTAFQAGRGRMSVRRQGKESAGTSTAFASSLTAIISPLWASERSTDAC